VRTSSNSAPRHPLTYLSFPAAFITLVRLLLRAEPYSDLSLLRLSLLKFRYDPRHFVMRSLLCTMMLCHSEGAPDFVGECAKWDSDGHELTSRRIRWHKSQDADSDFVRLGGREKLGEIERGRRLRLESSANPFERGRRRRRVWLLRPDRHNTAEEYRDGGKELPRCGQGHLWGPKSRRSF